MKAQTQRQAQVGQADTGNSGLDFILKSGSCQTFKYAC